MTVSGLDSIRAAFHHVRRHRELVVIEILWKWAWAVSVAAVAAASALFFLDSVTLSPTEVRGLRSGLPWLVGLILRRLWEQHAAVLLETLTLVVLASAVLWWLAASLFRSGIAGSLLEESGDEHPPRRALAQFGPSVRQSFGVYLGSHLWSLAVGAITFWLAAEVLWQMSLHQTRNDPARMTAFLAAVLGVAGLLFFWQFVAWVLGLGRAVASRRGWGFLRSLGFALHLFTARLLDVLFAATTMFLFRAMALALASALGLGIIYAAALLDRRLAMAGLIAALMLISVPARWLFVVQQAAYLELAGESAGDTGSRD